MAFLAVADVRKSSDWKHTKSWDGSRALGSREIIRYVNEHFHENISLGSYDDIRRKDLILPVTAGIIVKSAENPNAARNDPTRAYALAKEYAEVIREFDSARWETILREFMAGRPSLSERLAPKRELEIIPVRLPNGVVLEFSPGKHNQLQRQIIEEFLPRYGFDAEVLYVGDAANKFLLNDEVGLKRLGMLEMAHGELPDIVAFSRAKNWVYLIEAVHSSGPMSPLRVEALKNLLHRCTAAPVFLSAFLDRETFRRFAPDIAWETEVWIAESPDHLVHFNGDKFLGPYKPVR